MTMTTRATTVPTWPANAAANATEGTPVVGVAPTPRFWC